MLGFGLDNDAEGPIQSKTLCEGGKESQGSIKEENVLVSRVTVGIISRNLHHGAD